MGKRVGCPGGLCRRRSVLLEMIAVNQELNLQFEELDSIVVPPQDINPGVFGNAGDADDTLVSASSELLEKVDSLLEILASLIADLLLPNENGKIDADCAREISELFERVSLSLASISRSDSENFQEGKGTLSKEVKALLTKVYLDC